MEALHARPVLHALVDVRGGRRSAPRLVARRDRRVAYALYLRRQTHPSRRRAEGRAVARARALRVVRASTCVALPSRLMSDVRGDGAVFEPAERFSRFVAQTIDSLLALPGALLVLVGVLPAIAGGALMMNDVDGSGV